MAAGLIIAWLVAAGFLIGALADLPERGDRQMGYIAFAAFLVFFGTWAAEYL